MHDDVVGEADLLVEALPALGAHVGPHAAVREAETERSHCHLAVSFKI